MAGFAKVALGTEIAKRAYGTGVDILNNFSKDFPNTTRRVTQLVNPQPESAQPESAPPVGGSKKRRKRTKRKSNKRTKRKSNKRTKRKLNKRTKRKSRK